MSPWAPCIIECVFVCVLENAVPATPPRAQGKRLGVGWSFFLETIFIVSREQGWLGGFPLKT